MALALTATVLVFSIFFDAALSAPANPGLSPNPVRAPWYFAGLQELLLHLHPTVAVCVIPLLGGFFLVSIPYLAYPQSTEGIWFASTRGRAHSIGAFIIAAVILSALVLFDALVVKTSPWTAKMSPLFRDGLLPLILLFASTAAVVMILIKRYGCTLNETIQSLFVAGMTVLVMLTIVGVFFRGPAMQLIWPA